MTERINHQISDIPHADSVDIQIEPVIESRECTKEPEVKDQLFRKGKRDGREPAIEVAFMVLPMNPMQPTYVKRPVGRIVPDFGPNRGQN
jgi:hypothetical protein